MLLERRDRSSGDRTGRLLLAGEVNACALSGDAKARLVAEILNEESTHGRCTRTFFKKVRKQTRPA